MFSLIVMNKRLVRVWEFSFVSWKPIFVQQNSTYSPVGIKMDEVFHRKTMVGLFERVAMKRVSKN
jgi:hypothetical protein